MCEIDTQLLLKEYGIAFDNYSYRDRLIVQEFYLAIWLFSGLVIILSYFVYDKTPIEIPVCIKCIIAEVIAAIGFWALYILQISIDKLIEVREISMKRIEEIEECLSKKSKQGSKEIKDCFSGESKEKCCCCMVIGHRIKAIRGPSVSDHIKRFIQFMIVLWVGICIIMFTQIF